jgi:transcription antitermination factor NusG
MPGVLHFVSAGKIPVEVDADEISAIQAIANSGLLVQPWPFLRAGQTVMIEEGPLRNVTGILTYVDGSPRLVVSISLLQRSVSVTLPRAWIRPVDGSLPAHALGNETGLVNR